MIFEKTPGMVFSSIPLEFSMRRMRGALIRPHGGLLHEIDMD
jgi:hypothetical protein